FRAAGSPHYGQVDAAALHTLRHLPRDGRHPTRVPCDAVRQARRAKGAPGQENVERLEQGRLSVTVRTDERVEAGIRREAEGGVPAKPDQLDPSNLHPGRALLSQAHGHYNTEIRVVGRAPQHAGAESVLELDEHTLALHGRDGVQEVPRVEADGEILTRE